MSKNMLPCEFFVRGKRYTFLETSVSKEKYIYTVNNFLNRPYFTFYRPI